MRRIEVISEHLLDPVALGFSVNEQLSHNSTFELEFLTKHAVKNYELLLGTEVVISLEQPDRKPRRFFHAYIIGAEDAGMRHEAHISRLYLSTWLWFLNQNQNCRIFQDMSVPEIVHAVFQDYPLAKYEFALEDTYPQREYTVQYLETDLAFISRLLEDEGIFFRVDHSKDEHLVHFTDKQIYPELPDGYNQLPWLPDSEEMRAIREGVTKIERRAILYPNRFIARDYDFEEPRKWLEVETTPSENDDSTANVKLNWYDYGLKYYDSARGDFFAKRRTEMQRALARKMQMGTNALGIRPGYSFELYQHEDATRNVKYKVLSIQYSIEQDGPDSHALGGVSNAAVAVLPDEDVYRPEIKARKPRIYGIHSATVVGPEIDEVHTDKYGRIRVHFHWDRYKTADDEDASCWMRVVQAWAGKGWGVVAIPRVGQEVFVSYLNGDLDRPIVSGTTYNGDNPTPYTLPENKNYTGLVSRSISKAGQPENASQITFDDQRSQERVFIHAERDIQTTVERNSVETVDKDKFLEVAATSVSNIKDQITYKATSYSATGISVSYTGISTSFTGVSTSFTGISTSMTGISTSFTGVSTSFTGISASFTGVSTSFTGVNTSFTGVSTSFTGVSTSFTGVNTSFTGVSTSTTGVSTSFTGVSTSTTGTSTSMTGTSTSMTGTSTSTTGSSTSTTGSSTSTTGSSTSTTGTSRSNTGSSFSYTGYSKSYTGVSDSQTGTDISKKGTKTEKTGTKTATSGMRIYS